MSAGADKGRRIGRPEAFRIAEEYLRRLSEEVEAKLVIVDELTIQKTYGWVFFYDTEEHHLHGTSGSGLGGNSPFLVEKHGGAIRALPEHGSLKRQLAAYEASLRASDDDDDDGIDRRDREPSKGRKRKV